MIITAKVIKGAPRDIKIRRKHMNRYTTEEFRFLLHQVIISLFRWSIKHLIPIAVPAVIAFGYNLPVYIEFFERFAGFLQLPIINPPAIAILQRYDVLISRLLPEEAGNGNENVALL